MSHHKWFGGRRHASHQSYWSERPPYQDRLSRGFPGEVPRFGRAKPILWVLVLVGVGLWSLLAWVAYGVAEPFFGWVATNAGPFASGLGVSGIGGFFGQLSAWLQSIAKPAIVILWAAVALGMLAAPMILPAILRLRGRFHH